MPVLIVVGGLPATGKSTVAAVVAGALKAPFLRVDRIEQGIVEHTGLSHPVGPVGYAVAHAVAAEQLQLGLDVVVECVNPLPITRDAWPRTAASAGADVLEVEIVCSDPVEHRRRAETRASDVPGLVKPTWAEITGREYEAWERPHLQLDSATHTVPQLVQMIMDAAVTPAGERAC